MGYWISLPSTLKFLLCFADSRLANPVCSPFFVRLILFSLEKVMFCILYILTKPFFIGSVRRGMTLSTATSQEN